MIVDKIVNKTFTNEMVQLAKMLTLIMEFSWLKRTK